jgi:hypothetical protein
MEKLLRHLKRYQGEAEWSFTRLAAALICMLTGYCAVVHGESLLLSRLRKSAFMESLTDLWEKR